MEERKQSITMSNFTLLKSKNGIYLTNENLKV